MTTWKCPKCGRTETQPPTVRAVSHQCRPGWKPVALVKQETDR